MRSTTQRVNERRVAWAAEQPIRQSENERRERSNTESNWIVSGLTRNKFRIIRICAGRQAIATQTQSGSRSVPCCWVMGRSASPEFFAYAGLCAWGICLMGRGAAHQTERE